MISVVIPAYNEEKNIAQCLNAFTRQTTKKKFEIILVNNTSTDETRTIAETYTNKVVLRIISDPVKGRGHARSTGFSHADGNIILSSDADAIVPNNWIEKLSTALSERPKAVAVTGTCFINDCSPATNFLFNHFQPLFMRIYRLIFGHYWLSGFSFGILKDAYVKSGGFDPALNVQEDIDLSFKVTKIGKILFLPNIPVLFSGRRFQYGFFKGLRPYFKTFFQWRWRSNKNVDLSDPR